MGENKMDILETNVQHNTEDIRELKKKVDRHDYEISDVKTNVKVQSTTLGAMVESINEIKSSLKEESRKRQEDKEEETKRRNKEQEEQLKQYKNAIWKVAIAIITAFFLISLGLK